VAARLAVLSLQMALALIEGDSSGLVTARTASRNDIGTSEEKSFDILE